MPRPSAEQVRDLVREHLPDQPADEVALLGEGVDNVAFAVDDLVVRFAKEPDPGRRASAVHREARVLAVAGRVSPVPVPVPLLALPGRGCLAYRRLLGVPLLEAPGVVDPVALAAALADLLHALHAVPVVEVSDVLVADDEPLEAWRDDTAEQYAPARALVPARLRPVVEAFLAAVPPPRPAAHVFSHDDLGIENVLVDPGTGALTGVIDWTDAGLVDPASDCGRVLRDLGSAALEVVLDRLGGDLRERAVFYARCGALEDLAYGRETGRRVYVDKSLAVLDALFAP